MKIQAAALIFLTLATTFGHAASFDCNKASSFVEKAICNDTQLSKLDDTLNENYKHMSAANIGDGAHKDLKATQRAWLVTRNKCTDNLCLASSYKKRVDEICDYPVLSGAFPICKTSDEVDAELASVKPQQVAVPHKSEKEMREKTQDVAVKNTQKIKQLKLPANFVNSTLYVNYLGQWVDFMPCEKWLGLLFDNRKIESIQGISVSGNSGVLIKRPGQPSFGLLFRMEGKEAYLAATVSGDEISPIQTPAEHSQMAVLVEALTNEQAMD